MAMQDIRYALRGLKRAPGFATVAILTLALGIGANTAIFSIIEAVFLRALPFRDPGQLVRLYETEDAPGNYPFTGPDFLDWKTQNHTFQDMALFGWTGNTNLSGAGAPETVLTAPTESNFFSVLGAGPLLGRTFADDEDKQGREQVAVLSYSFWQSYFGGKPDVLNRQIELAGRKYTIIGVMPPDFRYPARAQMWIPLLMDSKSLGHRGAHQFNAVGRLKPGVSLQQAQADTALIAANLEKQYPDSNHKVNASLVALHEDLVGRSRGSLLMMLWAVALVLLIACANVANLLLSRSLGRQREMAVRSALGAGRARLVRQLLTESVLLGACGGLLGLLVAWGGIRLILSLKSIGIPSTNPISINPVVLAFTLVLAVLTGVLFGIIPALQISRPGVHDELKGGAGSSVTPTRARRLASDSLVVAEVGLSLLLLVAAGLLLKDFLRLRSSDIGVRPQGVWTAAVALPKASYPKEEQQAAFAQALLAGVQAIPGVESAALSDRLPLEGGSNGYVAVRGRPFQMMSGPLVETHTITPDYFKVMGIPLQRGRLLSDSDIAQSRAVEDHMRDVYESGKKDSPAVSNALTYPVVINQAMVKALWPDQDPLGQMFSFGDQNGPWAQVIGVVGDVKEWGLVHEPVPEQYSILSADRRVFITVHTSLSPAAVTSAVRGTVSRMDSSLPLFEIRTMDDVIAENASGQQFLATLIGLFAGLAVLLAAVGIYGVLSYLVTQRTREIGIRISLGASHGRVLALVLGRGMRLAAIGFAVGAIAALAAGKVIASLLHGVTARDPLIFAGTILGLGLVALLACYIPARRAARVNPVVALRYE